MQLALAVDKIECPVKLLDDEIGRLFELLLLLLLALAIDETVAVALVVTLLLLLEPFLLTLELYPKSSQSK